MVSNKNQTHYMQYTHSRTILLIENIAAVFVDIKNNIIFIKYYK